MTERLFISRGRAAAGASVVFAAAATVAPVNAETISSGFVPDPIVVETIAGGADSAADALADDCVGYLDLETPSYVFEYAAGEYDLAIYAESRLGVDLTLAVTTPAGDIVCNDDYSNASGRAPGIEFAAPESGEYRIWAGVYDSAHEGAAALLSVTERSLDPWPGTDSVETVEAGFLPDPKRIELIAGGDESAGVVFGSDCSGWIASGPDYSFRYEAGDHPLRFWVESDADTTLAVTAPSGETICSDDHPLGVGGAPGMEFLSPTTGVYYIRVGAYDIADVGEYAVLAISEDDFPWDGDIETASSATAFFVDTHLLVTNYHAVDDCVAISVRRPGETERTAALVASNAMADLALLRVQNGVAANDTAAIRGFPRVRLGEAVVVFGFPESSVLSPGGVVTDGIVTALGGGSARASDNARELIDLLVRAENPGGFGDMLDDLNQFQFSAELMLGSSGSAVLDSHGNVIGVAVSSLDSMHAHFGVRAGVLLTFLETNRFAREAVVSSGPALSTPDIADRARGFTAMVNCQS